MIFLIYLDPNIKKGRANFLGHIKKGSGKYRLHINRGDFGFKILFKRLCGGVVNS